jgi:hypothetical protein
MDFYLLDTSSQDEPSYCLLHQYPEGMNRTTFMFSMGEEAQPGDYPEDLRIYMCERDGGRNVPDLVGNTYSWLIASERLKASFEKVHLGPTQHVPLRIFNHKRRLEADNYFIVNPIGVLDVVNEAKSEIEWLDGEVVGVDKYVLDPKKLKSAPDLFRLKHEPQEYVVSERLLEYWRKMTPKPTNINLEPLDQA